jgi:hypothetical protein
MNSKFVAQFNQSISAITGPKRGFRYTTEPDRNGQLLSTLLINTSADLPRLGSWIVQCYSERTAGYSICVRFNGRCMDEVGCEDVSKDTTVDRKISISLMTIDVNNISINREL